MNTRREFVQDAAGATAGIAFVGCELLGAASAQVQARRREVVVNGRRVKVVDVHAHCAVPEAMALMGLKLGAPGSSLPPVLHLAQAASERLRAMDEQGIDVEALSINPYWYKADRDLARQLIRTQNEKLAEACAANPERFVAFASVALQHPDLAAEQLEQGVKKYGLRGAAIGGSVKKKPTEYLKQLYYDNIMFTPEAMRHLAAEVGSSQLVVGTDYPYPWTKTAVDLVLATPGLSDSERVAMLGGTAARLLGIKA
jgi:predicted TIM-barrel fold metal-dependent hydrolase